ncbi:MAG: hypothetical protein SV186_05710 [Candidatus Nanohaloarchaea archaeon]|nr:hypothetical protein [Candidatus Nanohaloarchaea archaeon]
MAEELGWVETTRRSNYLFWVGLGLVFIGVALYTTFGTGKAYDPAVTVAGFGFTMFDLLTLLGVPAGAYIILRAEQQARTRYYFDADGIVKRAPFPVIGGEEKMSYDEIDGAWWSESKLNSAAGSIGLYRDVESSPDMRLRNLARFDAVKQELDEKVDDLTYVKRRGSGGAGAGAAGGAGAV